MHPKSPLFSDFLQTGAQALRSGMLRRFGASLLVLPLAIASAHAGATAALGSYNVLLADTSVSGISSGAYMAVQFGVAYSSIIKGVGVVSGGPDFCAQDNVTTATTTCMVGTPSAASAFTTTKNWSNAGYIDPISNVANQKVYLFHGYNDGVIKSQVIDSLYTYYSDLTNSGNIYYKNNLNAGHGMVTQSYGAACTTSGGNFVNNCAYDAAGLLLQHIYGALNPKNTGTLSGSIVSFDQTAFHSSPANISMANTGYAYIPASCAAQQPCKVHVALHGCQQNAAAVGSAYYANAGYNQWADTNNIIVLYPQTVASSLVPLNPNGCWDWWGYNESTYAEKSGSQITMLRAMLTRLSGGYTGWSGAAGGSFGTPTNLVASDSSATKIALYWTPVGGATGYNVYRKTCSTCAATKINTALITSPSYGDSSLTASTTYYYDVTAVNSGGTESAASATVSKATAATPPSCNPYFRDNYTHWSEGRALVLYGLEYANGSSQYMGLWNIYVSTNLIETKSGYYVIGVCN